MKLLVQQFEAIMTIRCMALLLMGLSVLTGIRPVQAQRFDYDEVIERSFEVEQGQRLTLASDLGTVRIRGTRGDRVVVRAIKGADRMSRSQAEELFERFDVRFRQTSRGVEVEGDYDRPRSWRRNNNLRVLFEIDVPHAFAVDVNTSGGSITAEGFDGEAHVKTAGGSIHLARIGGEVIAHTSGGSIEAEDLGGRADLRTSGGSIRLRAVDGAVQARTSGGSITMDAVRGDVEAKTSGGSIRLDEIYGRVDAHTSGGSITADLAVQPDGPVTLQTSGGSVTVAVRDDIYADVDAHASGGRIRSDLPITVHGEISRDKLQGTLNGGGPLLTLRSSGGGVNIRSH